MSPEEILESIVSVRCTRAFVGPCEDCRLTVKSVIHNIETAGLQIQPIEEKEMPEVETLTEEITEEVVAPPVVSCSAPAPMVVNGAPYIGCQLPDNHEGNHEVKVTWLSK